MTETWSPRCPKCGGRGRAEVTPPANMIFAGRLRPEATKPYVVGTRDRCTRCLSWFTIGLGTEWKPNRADEKPKGPPPAKRPRATAGDLEGEGWAPEEGEGGSDDAALETEDR